MRLFQDWFWDVEETPRTYRKPGEHARPPYRQKQKLYDKDSNVRFTLKWFTVCHIIQYDFSHDWDKGWKQMLWSWGQCLNKVEMDLFLAWQEKWKGDNWRIFLDCCWNLNVLSLMFLPAFVSSDDERTFFPSWCHQDWCRAQPGWGLGSVHKWGKALTPESKKCVYNQTGEQNKTSGKVLVKEQARVQAISRQDTRGERRTYLEGMWVIETQSVIRWVWTWQWNCVLGRIHSL